MNPAATWRSDFLRLYIGQAFSLITSSAVQFSIIWWITVETGSALSLTIASVVGLLPQAVIGLFAGVWIDRFNRKVLMILADSMVALSSLILALSFLLGFESLLLVYVILFIRALGETFHKPALQAAIPQIVPSSELTKAGGLGQLVQSASSILGPMIGALLMSLSTLPYVMLVDILGAVIAVLVLMTVKLADPVRTTHKLAFVADFKEGLAAFKANKALMRLSIPMLITTLIFVPLGTLLPLMVKTYFQGGAWHNGLIQILFSCGMLIAAMVLGITGGLKRQFLMIATSTSLLGASALVAGLLPPTQFGLFCVLVFLMGASGMGYNIPFTAYIQRSVPTAHLGKVLSLITSIMSFAAPVGMFIAGPLSEWLGVSNWMVLSGSIMVGVGLLSYGLTRSLD